MKLNFNDFPALITERLLLRSISTEDFELIHRLHADPVTNAFVGRDDSSNLENAKAYIARIPDRDNG